MINRIKIRGLLDLSESQHKNDLITVIRRPKVIQVYEEKKLPQSDKSSVYFLSSKVADPPRRQRQTKLASVYRTGKGNQGL